MKPNCNIILRDKIGTRKYFNRLQHLFDSQIEHINHFKWNWLNPQTYLSTWNWECFYAKYWEIIRFRKNSNKCSNLCVIMSKRPTISLYTNGPPLFRISILYHRIWQAVWHGLKCLHQQKWHWLSHGCFQIGIMIQHFHDYTWRFTSGILLRGTKLKKLDSMTSKTFTKASCYRLNSWDTLWNMAI